MHLKQLAFAALFLPVPLSAQEKPNILLFYTDDLGATALACTGSDLHQTPHLDRLAEQGVIFTRAYAPSHVCSPSRAGVLTGKAPARVRLTDFMKGHVRPHAKLKVPDWNMGLPSGIHTLGHMFQKQGYATAWLGKWHVGGSATDFGFDAGKQEWIHNRKDDEEDVKGAFTLNKEAQQFIEENRAKPFFVTISHYTPHGPVRFVGKVKDKYQAIIDKKKPTHDNAEFAAMIESMDDSVGEMLAWLDEKGLADDTLVIFTSDNGGELIYTNNLPLRNGKGSLYEGGIRVPMIARWPGKLPAGETNDTLFGGSDLLPTFASLAGGGIPADIDGKDLSSVFLENKRDDRETLHWHYPHYHNEKPAGAIIKGDWKLIEWFESEKNELFNLAADPTESKDLSTEEPEKTRELLADLKAWREEVGAQMMEPNPDHDPELAGKSVTELQKLKRQGEGKGKNTTKKKKNER